MNKIKEFRKKNNLSQSDIQLKIMKVKTKYNFSMGKQ